MDTISARPDGEHPADREHRSFLESLPWPTAEKLAMPFLVGIHQLAQFVESVPTSFEWGLEHHVAAQDALAYATLMGQVGDLVSAMADRVLSPFGTGVSGAAARQMIEAITFADRARNSSLGVRAYDLADAEIAVGGWAA